MRLPEVGVDETLSYAHRDGDGVKVRLRVPGQHLRAGAATVRLKSGERGFRAVAEITADEDGATVAFDVPAAKLRQATWSLEVRRADEDAVIPVQARLLARRDQPVALLPGPVPTTRLPAPRPDRQQAPVAVRAARRLPAPARRVLRRGRAALVRNRA